MSGDWSGQLIATAIHNGHDLRPATVDEMILDESTRLREEDPYTDVIGAAAPATVVVNRSRFEVDLNRRREDAVYRRPEDCWGLEVWKSNPLPEDIAEGSLEVYDEFYAELGCRLDEVALRGPFVVYDVHSYNHRRDGDDAEPAPLEGNPEVNLGTGTVDKQLFGAVVDAFASSLGSQRTEVGPIGVGENVKFKGRALSRWVHARYAGVGCCLALEFKKTFMDEWTGEPDHGRLEQLQGALAATHGPVLDALGGVQRR